MRNRPVEAVTREFRRRLARRQIAFLVVIVPGVLAYILLPRSTTAPFVLPACGMLAVLAILDWLTWRCPACDGALSSRSVDRVCPKCGVSFRNP